jgi:hypothetical protein
MEVIPSIPQINAPLAFEFFSKINGHYTGLVRLAGCQPASSAFLSHQFSISHQPPATSQPTVFFSHNESASATSHQLAERGNCLGPISCNRLWTTLEPTE